MFGLWCNGSTTGFGSVCPSSNLGSPTKKALTVDDCRSFSFNSQSEGKGLENSILCWCQFFLLNYSLNMRAFSNDFSFLCTILIDN